MHFLSLYFLLQDGVNILGVNYGAPGACPYPRQLKLVRRDQTFCFCFLLVDLR